MIDAKRSGGNHGARADDEPVFRFEQIRKSYYQRGRIIDAVGPVSFEVHRGEFVALVGPSGCGKSTVLNMAAGLIEPTGGTTSFVGREVRDINTGVGYMTQNDSLLPWRTVTKNVRLPLEMPPGRRSDRAAAVERAIKTVGLTGFENSYPSELSGGMRKRVALARTLVHESGTLLMDEPFGALDAQLRMVMHNELLRICGDASTTVMFVTHDLQEALTLADRVVVFTPRPGLIRDVLDVDLPRPRNPFKVQFEPEFATLHAALWSLLEADVTEGEAM